MANTQKFRAHESLAVDTAGDWQEQSVATVGATTTSFRVDGYHQIHILPDNDIYFTFSKVAHGTTDAINTSNSFYLKGGDTIYTLKIPHGLGDTIYLQWQRVDATTTKARYVLA